MTTDRGGDRSRWLKVPHPRPHAGVRVVVLPHAGGTATFFRPWGAALPEWAELTAVQYPGRESRIGEDPLGDARAMADGVVEALEAERAAGDVRRIVLFGHSLGATLGYEVARRLPAAPIRLVVSARMAPTVPPRESTHLGTDDELVARLRALGGTDTRVLDEPEMRELVLPAYRADLRAAETYTHEPRPPLTCPVEALAGADDPAAAPSDVERWADVAPAGFRLTVLPGGHFYLQGQPDRVLAAVLDGLSGYAGAPSD
ncbi:MAG: alpha/beta fold hydrolase [Pseudonocardia sp.]|nr:alpha/beta fold hydrolase [Pseudonocardia sp.]